VLLFTLECGLGIVLVILVAALAHGSASLSPVVVLLYLLIVVFIALLCGFWQSVIVSLFAVVIQSYFGMQQTRFDAATETTNSVTVMAFILIALVVSRLSSRVTEHARNAQSWGEQMHELYEFTRRSLQMDLHEEPGSQLAELAHDIFALEGVIVFDADLT
jgi:two-component system sensor histidine kinase KdpD